MNEDLQKFRNWSEHLNPHYISEGIGKLSIVETAKEGAGIVTFESAHPWLKIGTKSSEPPVLWLKTGSCADGAFLIFKDGLIELHVVELKTTIKADVWRNAREQCFGMILNALALLGLMQLQITLPIFCYIVFKNNKIDPPASGNLIASKPPVGGSQSFGHLEEWRAERISFPQNLHAVLVKVTRDTSGNATYQL